MKWGKNIEHHWKYCFYEKVNKIGKALEKLTETNRRKIRDEIENRCNSEIHTMCLH